ncbi:UbiA family prenyltransferase [Candidatus Omnitrophota bacterium]
MVKKFLKMYFMKELSYRAIFYWLLGLIGVRIFFDWTLLEYPAVVDGLQNIIRFSLENTYYFLILFLLCSALIALFTKEPLRRVMNFWVRLYPLIIIPPFIDRFMFGHVEGYFYARSYHFALNFFTFFIAGDATPGLSLEILIGLAFVFGVVYRKTRSFLKALFCIVLINFILAVMSTPDLFFGEARGDYVFDYFLPLYYFIPFFILFCLAIYTCAKEKIFSAFNNIRWVRSFVFVLSVCLGCIARYVFTGELSVLYCVFGGIVAFLVWQVSVMVNDISDIEIDRQTNKTRPLVSGVITVEEYAFSAEILVFIALSFAAIANEKVFLLACLQCVLAYVYSLKPFRLRKHFGGNVLIGVSVAVAFWMGLFMWGPQFSLNGQMWFLSFLLFCFGTLISLVKDIKDFEGDRAQGITNIFTLCGKQKGKRITTGLIFLTLSMPAVAFANLFFVLLGGIASFLYYKFESIQAVYLFGIIATYYSLLNIIP